MSDSNKNAEKIRLLRQLDEDLKNKDTKGVENITDRLRKLGHITGQTLGASHIDNDESESKE